MDVKVRDNGSATNQSNEEMELKKGAWTVEEDSILFNYINAHGEGRWNSVARSTGLKRTGKSCRLRWLNYLKPTVRRGSITLQEQLLILELHFRWGNRWSKIAQYLPGRTDNEIKNYWRTRVQKQAKHLKCDVNSKQFKDAMRHVWMPRLLERIQALSRPESSVDQPQPVANQAFSDYPGNQIDITSTSLTPQSNWVNPCTVPDITSTSPGLLEVQVSSIPDFIERYDPLYFTSCEYGSGLMEQFMDAQFLNSGLGGSESVDVFWNNDDTWNSLMMM